ncbi:MAG TPA: hypothetical protein VIZ28_00870 [Chitinophagaceae bacterium]
MKVFKIIDATISLALILVLSIWYLQDPSFDSLIESYLITGGWQLISMFVHAIGKWFTKKWGVRYVYHWIALISVVTMPMGSIWILAFTAPFMAIFYTCLCYYEVFMRMK